MKPPPPRLPADGYVTASAKPTATAASMALPPAAMTSAPTFEAISERETIIPSVPRTTSGVWAVAGCGSTMTAAIKSNNLICMPLPCGPGGRRDTERYQSDGQQPASAPCC